MKTIYMDQLDKLLTIEINSDVTFTLDRPQPPILSVQNWLCVDEKIIYDHFRAYGFEMKDRPIQNTG
jgi:hypothetical protein